MENNRPCDPNSLEIPPNVGCGIHVGPNTTGVELMRDCCPPGGVTGIYGEGCFGYVYCRPSENATRDELNDLSDCLAQEESGGLPNTCVYALNGSIYESSTAPRPTRTATDVNFGTRASCSKEALMGMVLVLGSMVLGATAVV